MIRDLVIFYAGFSAGIGVVWFVGYLARTKRLG